MQDMDVSSVMANSVARQDLTHASIAALYTAIYRYVLDQSRIAELTVEDPAEAFEDLRDRNDLNMLLSHEKFITEALGCSKDERKLVKGKGKLGPPAEKGWVEKWRQDLKIAGVRLPSPCNPG